MATTFEEALAECKALKLGPSACLEHLEPFCDGNPKAFADGRFTCAQPISTRQAEVLRKEAEAVVTQNAGPPWLLIGGGIAAIGLVLYIATRQ